MLTKGTSRDSTYLESQMNAFDLDNESRIPRVVELLSYSPTEDTADIDL
jgi:hypothetical protein